MKEFLAEMTTLQKIYIGFFAGMMFIALNFYHSHLGGSGTDLPFNAVTWIFASGIIATGLWQIGKSQQLVYNKTMIIIGIGSLLLWVPMLYPNQQVGEFAIGRLVGVLAGWMIMMSLLQMRFKEMHWNKFLLVIVISAMLFSISALLLFYGFFDKIIRLKGNTAAGIFAQRNVASTFILFGISSLMWLLAKPTLSTKLQPTLIVLAPLLFAWMIAINESRSGHINILTIILLSAPYLFSKASKKHLQLFYIGLVAGFVTPHILNLFLEIQAVTRDSLSTSVRITIWTVALNMFFEKPWLGWGYGSFDAAYLTNQSTYLQNHQNPSYVLNVGHPHNELIYWAIEGGVFPILVLLGMTTFVIVKFFKKPFVEALFYTALIFSPLFHSLVEFPFYHAAMLWILFCLFLAIMSTQLEPIEIFNPPSKFAPQLFASVIPLITIVYMSISIDTLTKLINFQKSKFTDLKQLENIISPIPQLTLYSINARYIQLIIALSQNEKDELENYITWHEKIRQRLARPQMYYNHVLALTALDRKEEANALFEEAKKLFFDHHLFDQFPETQQLTSSSTTEKLPVPFEEPLAIP